MRNSLPFLNLPFLPDSGAQQVTGVEVEFHSGGDTLSIMNDYYEYYKKTIARILHYDTEIQKEGIEMFADANHLKSKWIEISSEMASCKHRHATINDTWSEMQPSPTVLTTIQTQQIELNKCDQCFQELYWKLCAFRTEGLMRALDASWSNYILCTDQLRLWHTTWRNSMQNTTFDRAVKKNNRLREKIKYIYQDHSEMSTLYDTKQYDAYLPRFKVLKSTTLQHIEYYKGESEQIAKFLKQNELKVLDIWFEQIRKRVQFVKKMENEKESIQKVVANIEDLTPDWEEKHSRLSKSNLSEMNEDQITQFHTDRLSLTVDILEQACLLAYSRYEVHRDSLYTRRATIQKEIPRNSQHTQLDQVIDQSIKDTSTYNTTLENQRRIIMEALREHQSELSTQYSQLEQWLNCIEGDAVEELAILQKKCKEWESSLGIYIEDKTLGVGDERCFHLIGEGEECIKRETPLKSLCFLKCTIKNEFMTFMGQSKTRRTVLNKLEKLEFKGNRIEGVGVDLFFISKFMLPKLHTVVVVEGSQNGPVWVKGLSDAISNREFISLKNLVLNFGDGAPLDIQQLAVAIKPFDDVPRHRLETLNLNSNSIGDTEMAHFAEAVNSGPDSSRKALPNLKKLYLQKNKITDVGLTAFVEIVVMNGHMHALEELDVQENLISGLGIQILAKAIRYGFMPSLKALFIGRNNIYLNNGDILGSVLADLRKACAAQSKSGTTLTTDLHVSGLPGWR
tara:strand:- start:299 stop:2506 length:2208 start_codon:yes stop_codon:yes gene_type:complete